MTKSLNSSTDSPSIFEFDEKKHVYTLGGKPLMGVTSVLQIISKPALIGWAARMATEYVRDNLKSLDDLEKVLEAAKGAHNRKKKEAADAGTDTHALVENYVKGCIADYNGEPVPSPEDSAALQSFIKYARLNRIMFLGSEMRVFSKEWWTAGTLDLLIKKDEKIGVADIKTYKKIWDRIPAIQMGAYSKMLKESHGITADFTLVMNIPKETNIVESNYYYDIPSDIKLFEAALLLYKGI